MPTPLLGVRTLAWTLALRACGAPAPAEPPPVEAPGLHRERWYGWSLLLPDGCAAPEEERWEGRPIGRARWQCPDMGLILDATPFADPLHHTAAARFAPGAALCAAARARDVEFRERPPGPDRPIPALAYWEVLPGESLAVHQRAEDRRVTLIAFVHVDQGGCDAAERVVRSLRPEGPPHDVPAGEVRSPLAAFLAPSPDCHRHYAWPSCKPGAPSDEALHCGDLRVEWREWPPGHTTPAAPATPAGAAGPWAYDHRETDPTSHGPGGPSWTIQLPRGVLGVWAPLTRAAEVVDLLARTRVPAGQ